MLAENGYFELNLINDHKLQVWTTGRLCVLRHPKGCDSHKTDCRDKLMKYIEDEGILDEVDKIIMIDSYEEE